jgi:hypothetical protein
MIPIDIDPPMHGAYRKILLPLFTPKAVDQLTPFVEATSQELADEIARHNIADLSHGFARPVPTIVFSTLVGYPRDDWPKFDDWVDRIIYSRTSDTDDAERAGDEVRAYLSELIERRKSEPPIDDITGRLLTATIDGRPLSEEGWNDPAAQTLMMYVGGSSVEDPEAQSFLIVVHGGGDDIAVTLPAAPYARGFEVYVDTFRAQVRPGVRHEGGAMIPMHAYSMLVLRAE